MQNYFGTRLHSAKIWTKTFKKKNDATHHIIIIEFREQFYGNILTLVRSN